MTERKTSEELDPIETEDVQWCMARRRVPLGDGCYRVLAAPAAE